MSESMLLGQEIHLSMPQLQQKKILSLVHCPWLCNSRLRRYVCEQKLKFSRDNGMDFTQDAVSHGSNSRKIVSKRKAQLIVLGSNTTVCLMCSRWFRTTQAASLSTWSALFVPAGTRGSWIAYGLN